MDRVRGPAILVTVWAIAFLVGACPRDRPPKLPGLVHPLPIFAPSSYKWKGDGTIYGEGGPWHSRCWFLKAKAPSAKVVAFYQAKLPEAALVAMGPHAERELAEGEAFFRFVPEGRTKDEGIEVSVRREEFSICESIHMSRKSLREE